jgi:hypothetical protein
MMADGYEIFVFAVLSEVFTVAGGDVGECNDLCPHSAKIKLFQLLVCIAVVCERLHDVLVVNVAEK